MLTPGLLEFGTKRAGHWGSAVSGCSALRFALQRALRCELASWQGHDVVQLLLDVSHVSHSVTQGATESPQKHENSPKEAPKNAQNDPKRAPKRFKDHHRIQKADFSKHIDCLC